MQAASEEGPGEGVIELWPDLFMSPGLSVVVAYGPALALPFTLALVMLARALLVWLRGRRRQVLSGTVHYAAGAEPLRIVVEQKAVPKGKSSAQKVWTEIDRRVEPVPFTLTLDAGRELLVEPNDTTLIYDPPVLLEEMADDRRLYGCVLPEGARVEVEGQEAEVGGDGGNYRASGKRVVLRGAKDGALHISSAPFAEHDRRRWWSYFGVALAALFAIALQQGLWSPFHANLWWGKTGVGQVVGTWKNIDNSDGSETITFNVKVRVEEAEGFTFVNKVKEEELALLPQGTKVRVIYYPGWTEHAQLGSEATEHFIAFPVSIILFIGLIGLIVQRERALAPWFRRPLRHRRQGSAKATKTSA